jgi:hypothetical protein
MLSYCLHICIMSQCVIILFIHHSVVYSLSSTGM